MISRVKYYRRRKAEFLKNRRKIKNTNYFLYTYRYIMRKIYLRNFKNHINSFPILAKLNTNINSVFLFSRKRRHEIDDFEDDEVDPKKQYPEGLYYTYSKMLKTQKNLLTIFSALDAEQWHNYRTFFNSIPIKPSMSVFTRSKGAPLTAIARIISMNFIRWNYGKIFRMDRIKFPVINYYFKNKTIKTMLKYNYYFRKMGGFLWRRKLWLKKFTKNSLWKYTRMLKLKLLNNIKIIIHKTYNNFYITALKGEKQVIVSYSAGCSGLKGSKRLSPVSAEKVAKKFIFKLFDKLNYFANIDIYLRSSRIDAAIRNILNVLIKTKKIQYSKIFKRRILIRLVIKNLIMATKTSHNGVRKRHQRRV